MPNFDSNDLWLQRRALIACLKHYGVAFLIENLHAIRDELIHYTLLKRVLCGVELEQLKIILASSKRYVRSDSSLEEMTTLIEQLQAQGG